MARKRPHWHTLSPGPSPRVSSPADVPMATSTDRHFSDDTLKATARELARSLGSPLWITDSPSIADYTLLFVHEAVYKSTTQSTTPIQVVDRDQYERNVTKKSASGFTDLLVKALGSEDLTLWLPVITHGASPSPTASTYLLTAPFSNLRRVSLGDPR